MKKVDNIIFLSNHIDIRAGGPCGYIANLKEGLEKEGIKNIVVVCDERKNDDWRIKAIKILSYLLIIAKWRKLFYRRMVRKYEPEMVDRLNVKEKLAPYFKKILDSYSFKTITCHTGKDVMKIRTYLNERGLNAKILQMEHSPTLESQELYDLYKNQDIKKAVSIRNMWKEFEKKAFFTSDILVAPAPEALEQYIMDAPYFKKMLEQKPVKYVATGCKPLQCELSKEVIKAKYGIKTKYIISYIGRHIPVRGYTILTKLGEKLLKQRNDVSFLIAGKEDKNYPAPNHPRWIETGWCNPAEILKAADLMVLPGKSVYFDLILLETMSMGTPILASNIQGNKAVFKQSSAIDVFDTEKELFEKINQFLDSSEKDKELKSQRVINGYKNFYTLNCFAKNYENMIKRVIHEK